MKANLQLRSGFSILTAVACTVLLAPLVASGGEATFRATLQGTETWGSTDGQAEATVTLNAETNQVDVRLSYSNIARPTAMHIRKGPTGLQGNVEVPIVIESDDGGTIVGSRTSAKLDVVERILAAPGDYYLVVINEEYPVGALRGPLQE